MDTKTIILLLLGGCLVFFLGYSTKDNQQVIIDKAGQEAFKASSNYVKSQADITKNWFNQISNQIKQIWSK